MLLLNVCCAPCGLPLIEHLLSSREPNPTLYFYGPNIYPEGEYEKRLEETKRVAATYSLEIYEGEYEHEAWRGFVERGLPQPPENYPENGDRCRVCFQSRLEKTAAFAREKGFSEFATTLSISRHKDTVFINGFGDVLGEKFKMSYRTFPVDAREAHRRGLELSRKLSVYRQKYCGCEFSLRRDALGVLNN